MDTTQVGFATQMGPPRHRSQQPNTILQVHFVYPDGMNDSQVRLLDEAKRALSEMTMVKAITPKEVSTVPLNDIMYFVIPYVSNELRSRITGLKGNTKREIRVFTSRTVIECIKYQRIDGKLPVKQLTISTAMHNCNVHLSHNLWNPDNFETISRMCGVPIRDLSDTRINVIVTHRANTKQCPAARNRNIPLVSMEWIKDTLMISNSGNDDKINHDALTTVAYYKIKVFMGLRFKIKDPELSKSLRTLITDNLGMVCYGDAEDFTHIVGKEYSENHPSRKLVVDAEFLEKCVQLGYFMSPEEYRTHRASRGVTIKQEIITQSATPQRNLTNCFTPPDPNARSTLSSLRSNGYENRLNSQHNNNQMLPPSSHMPNRRSEYIQDVILKALESLNGPQQTQQPSTQIRRLPESEIQVERICEPSQQLYWNDNCTRRR